MKAKAIYKHLFQRRLPFGLFSWRFLLPNQPPPIQFHRLLIMQHLPKIPRAIFLVIALFVGFRWMLCYSPYYTFKVVRKRGKQVHQSIGMPLWHQYLKVLAISMGHGIPPSNWYFYQMHKTKKDFWNRLYNHETAGFHHYRNRRRFNNTEHTSLLGDKWLFEKYLYEHGIATTNSILLVKKNTNNFQSTLKQLALQHGQLFCKRRVGNQGIGAFSALLEDGNLHIYPREGGVFTEEDEINIFLKKNLKIHDYLVQKNYRHHHIFQGEGGAHQPESTVTVRVISRNTGETTHFELALLYWPTQNKQKMPLYYPIAISPQSGVINKSYPLWPHENFTEKQLEELTNFINSLTNRQLPFWPEALKTITESHLLLSGVDQIAWDLILSQNRAILLEGNSGWGPINVCQWFGYNAERYFVTNAY